MTTTKEPFEMGSYVFDVEDSFDFIPPSCTTGTDDSGNNKKIRTKFLEFTLAKITSY